MDVIYPDAVTLFCRGNFIPPGVGSSEPEICEIVLALEKGILPGIMFFPRLDESSLYVGRNGSAGAGFNFIRTGSKTGGTDFEVVFIKSDAIKISEHLEIGHMRKFLRIKSKKTSSATL